MTSSVEDERAAARARVALMIEVWRQFIRKFEDVNFQVFPKFFEVNGSDDLEESVILEFGANISQQLSELETRWNEIAPRDSFEYVVCTRDCRMLDVVDELWGALEHLPHYAKHVAQKVVRALSDEEERKFDEKSDAWLNMISDTVQRAIVQIDIENRECKHGAHQDRDSKNHEVENRGNDDGYDADHGNSPEHGMV